MLVSKVTPRAIELAKEKADEMGTLRNSITEGEGNLAGFIGEILFCNYLKGTQQNTYDYDIIKGGIKWDVKTKRCTSPPKNHYECSVAAFNTRQRCDNYCFVRIVYNDDNWGDAYLLGWMPKEEYFEKAHFLRKGEIDPANNFKVKADCYNLPISSLRSF